MKEIAGFINEVLSAKGAEDAVNGAKEKVRALTKKFPLYQEELKRIETKSARAMA